MSKPELPESLESYRASYKEDAWLFYSVDELGHFVHLMMKRATHRSEQEKALKDLHDAQNYLDMMQAKLDAAFEDIENPENSPT